MTEAAKKIFVRGDVIYWERYNRVVMVLRRHRHLKGVWQVLRGTEKVWYWISND